MGGASLEDEVENYRPLFAHLFPGTNIDALTHLQWIQFRAFADSWKAADSGE